jgi:hypothetical protein
MKVQVRNMRVPVASMRVKDATTSQWMNTTRSLAFFVYDPEEEMT